MLSDERVPVALAAMRHPIAEFRATVEGALAQAAIYLASLERDPAARATQARHELGVFADGRVNAEDFAALFAPAVALMPADQGKFSAAVETLRELLTRGDDLHVASVPAGGSLARVVEDALARMGRAFGAVLAIELLRGGAFRPEEHDRLLEDFAFRSWSRAGRRFAPPLVVMVSGADLQVGGLADFSDGRERIVLVVQGDCPPAPLVRLITPGTMVLQTIDATGLEQLALHDGPGIAAMVSPNAARFLHDPRAGREPWQRLSVWHMPEVPKHAIGGFSPWQMTEDIKQLAALAAAPAEAPLPAAAGSARRGGDSVDRLANWLLSQSDLKGIT